MQTGNLVMERYNRHIILPEIGEEGQRKLEQASVLLIGVGGLGSAVSLYLTAAGIGHLGIIDDDVVSETNLQRQVLYTEEEVGRSKVLCAQKRLNALNHLVQIDTYAERFSAENAETLIGRYDIVVDGSDNFTTRYLISQVTAKLQKPYVYGAIREFDGQVSVFNLPGGRCYRDLFPEEETAGMPIPPKGVFGVLPGMVGCAEATEVIKLITGCGESLSGKLWTIDLKTMQSYTIEV